MKNLKDLKDILAAQYNINKELMLFLEDFELEENQKENNLLIEDKVTLSNEEIMALIEKKISKDNIKSKERLNLLEKNLLEIKRHLESIDILVEEKEFNIIRNTYETIEENFEVKKEPNEKLTIVERINKINTNTNNSINFKERNKEIKINKGTNIEKDHNLIREKSFDKLSNLKSVNALNIIGILFVVVAISSFGYYIYDNYMSDFLKGMSLFVISGIFICLGRYTEKGKYKLTESFYSIGTSGMYISILINSIVLLNLDFYVTTIILIIAFILSIVISLRLNSFVIRAINIVGATITLIFMNRLILSAQEEFIIVFLFTALVIVNFLLKFKNSIVYEIFNLSYCTISNLIIVFFVGSTVIKGIYLIIIESILFYSYITIKKSKGNYKKSSLTPRNAIYFFYIFYVLNLIVSLTSINWFFYDYLLIGKTSVILITLNIIFTIVYRIFNFKDTEIKDFLYMNFIISVLIITYEKNMYIYLITLFISTVYTFRKYLENNKRDYVKYFASGLAVIYFYYMVDMNLIVYVIFMIPLVIYLIKYYPSHKEKKVAIALKYLILFSPIFLIDSTFLYDLDIYYANFYILLVSIVALVINNNFESIKESFVFKSNLIIIALTLSFNILILFNVNNYLEVYSLDEVVINILMIIINICIVIFFISEKYIENKFILKNKRFIESLVYVYSAYNLSSILLINYTTRHVTLSIALMLIALKNINDGFKDENEILRIAGLVLSFLICTKLVFVDFFFSSFRLKSIIFFIVGMLAIVISVRYRKLQEKNIK